MPAEWTCPECREPIEIHDVDPTADVAVCRACELAHPFAELEYAQGPMPVDRHRLPRGVRIVSDPDVDLRVVHRRVSPLAAGLVPFTLVWICFGALGLQVAARRGSLDAAMAVFVVFLVATSAYLVATSAMCLLGRTEVAVQAGDGTVFVGVGSLGSVHHFRYDHRSRVRLEEESRSRRIHHRHRPFANPLERIVVDGSHDEFAFGQDFMGHDARRAIAGLLQEAIRRA